MKLAHIFMLICAAFLSASPALAHGDEVHGETPSAQVPAQPDKMAGMEGMHSSQIAPGEPVPGEGNAGSKSGEHESDNAGFFAFLTKLHPATVHFPVALFLMAALAELFMLRGKDTVEPAISVLIYGGAAGGILAATFGWIHTGLWFGGDTVMQIPRMNGMLIAILGLALVLIVRRTSATRTSLRAGLLLMTLLILVQGFLGGELAQGQNHLGLSWL